MAVYDNPELGPEFLEQLEESLVMADVGVDTADKIIKALRISYCEFFDDAIDVNDTESRKFYTDIIEGCLKRLPEEKLKIVADVVMKITDLAE